jgi:hypothetical protein
MVVTISGNAASKLAELVSDTGEAAESLIAEAVENLYVEREYTLCRLKVNVRGYGEEKKWGETVRLPTDYVNYLIGKDLAEIV